MRISLRSRVFGAAFLSLALVVTACGGDEGTSGGDTEATGDTTVTTGAPEGPTITVASFNFPESVILAEIYAQAMESNGYPVERRLNLGSRELIFPEIESGNIDFLPEYVGSSLAVGFGQDPPSSTDDGVEKLRAAFADLGMRVLDPAPGEDKNAFVVTGQFADDNDLASVADLAGVGDVVLGGPPECEERQTCYLGVVENYGLDNLSFESIAEGSARVAALESGEIDVALLFSTQPVIQEKGFVSLEDPEQVLGAENIIPVVSEEVVDAYDGDFTSLINDISSNITTDVLLDLNGRVELQAEDPADVATAWLEENGYLNG